MSGALRITAAVVFVLISLTVLLSDTLDAMSWPSEDAVLTGNFGSINNGKPVLGMLFSGGTQILAAEKGDVIFPEAGPILHRGCRLRLAHGRQ
jgi:hypothetical protein